MTITVPAVSTENSGDMGKCVTVQYLHSYETQKCIEKSPAVMALLACMSREFWYLRAEKHLAG